MSQIAKQSNKFEFLVEAAPSYMQLPDGTFAKDGFTVNRRTDTMQVLGKVTDRYGIVQNSDLISSAEDAFAAKGLNNYKRNIVVTGEGEKMYAVYDFSNRTKKLKVGDEVGLRLTVKNSFDGTLRASYALGMLRLTCLNGATTITNEIGMTKKHGSSINVKFVTDSIDNAIASWEDSLKVYDNLSDMSITQEQGRTILKNLEKQAVLSGKLRENIQNIWENPTHHEDRARNMFNLYNAVTQHLTHGVSNERFELSNRVSENVLSVFDRVSRNSDRFAKLLKPSDEAKIVAVDLSLN